MRVVKSSEIGTVCQYGAVLSISCFTGDSVTATVSLVVVVTGCSSEHLYSDRQLINISPITM